jgi:hypothetical protein
VAPGPGLDVLEVKSKDVVALDDVGIALANELRARLQQRGLGEAIAAEDVAEARGVGQGDGNDAIARARRAGKLVALAGQDLDVEREAAQVVEVHPAEGGGSRGQQELMDRVPGEPVGCAARAVARGQRAGPCVEARQPGQLPGTLEGLDRDEIPGVRHGDGIRDQQERGEDRRLDGDAGTEPPVEPHGAAAGFEGTGHEPRDRRRHGQSGVITLARGRVPGRITLARGRVPGRITLARGGVPGRIIRARGGAPGGWPAILAGEPGWTRGAILEAAVTRPPGGGQLSMASRRCSSRTCWRAPA